MSHVRNGTHIRLLAEHPVNLQSIILRIFWALKQFAVQILKSRVPGELSPQRVPPRHQHQRGAGVGNLIRRRFETVTKPGAIHQVGHIDAGPASGHNRAAGDVSFKWLTYQLSMVRYMPTMVITGNGESGFDSGEGA